MDKVAVQ